MPHPVRAVRPRHVSVRRNLSVRRYSAFGKLFLIRVWANGLTDVVFCCLKAEGTYALRLTRDPFYIERGEHVYEVQGERRSRYVHPVYMHTYDLEVRLKEIRIRTYRQFD